VRADGSRPPGQPLGRRGCASAAACASSARPTPPRISWRGCTIPKPALPWDREELAPIRAPHDRGGFTRSPTQLAGRRSRQKGGVGRRATKRSVAVL
jgi:hypothetical protein